MNHCSNGDVVKLSGMVSQRCHPSKGKKRNWPAGGPWNVSHFVTVFHHGLSEGLWELVSYVLSHSISPTVDDQTLLFFL